jgi:hypothetical protein
VSPVVNIGLLRTRDRMVGLNAASTGAAVDSLGIGSNDAAEAPGDTRLGAGAAPANASSWKSGAGLTVTSIGGGAADPDPAWQFEATWGTAEANFVVFEIGTSAGALAGDNPAGNDGTRLYSRKRIGGAGGIGKTADIELVGRLKVTY